MRDELEYLEQFRVLLRDLESDLAEVNVEDSSRFAEVLEQSMVFLNLQPRDIAEEFGTSEATVSRWRSGRNTPFPSIRKMVYEGLRRRTAAAARAAELRLKQVSGLTTEQIRTQGDSEDGRGQDGRRRPEAGR